LGTVNTRQRLQTRLIDLGQAENPIHPMGFKVFILAMLANGVARDAVDLMVRKNPARMLDLT
jgi:predicted metal-dependent phosphotriesterase family hydrolase